MRRTGLSLLSLITPLLIIIYHPVFGQTPTDDQAVKTRTDLVNVGILARRKKTGRIVANLTKDDFSVFEDGVQQTVSYFSRERLPLSIILLVDRAGCINAFNDQIRAAAVKAFGGLKPEDEVAIMTFSNKVALAQPFTRDSRLIAEKIMAVEGQHHSEQHYFNAGIYEAANYMSSDIAESYSLAYVPTNSARDGKRRKIKVTLSPDAEKREGQMALITRRSYIMPKEAN